MSLQEDQSALMKKESTESDAGAIKAMQALQQEKQEEKPQIVIQSADLTIVMNATHLSRNDAISLIESTNGNIKDALCKYVENSTNHQ